MLRWVFFWKTFMGEGEQRKKGYKKNPDGLSKDV